MRWVDARRLGPRSRALLASVVHLLRAGVVGLVVGPPLLTGYLVALAYLDPSTTADPALSSAAGVVGGATFGPLGGLLAGLVTLPWRARGATVGARVAAACAPLPALVFGLQYEVKSWATLLLGVALGSLAGAAAAPWWLGRPRATSPDATDGDDAPVSSPSG
ncbi:hypothetical protein FTX61_10355 [Nitriliruptoraceae bacterium ZYF776]|nr:hypothetical protein [Profundirhabdus halotolerans]